MSDTDLDREELSAEDAALVRLVDEAWRAPRMSAARRVAFQERLDERVATRNRQDRVRRLAGLGAVAAALGALGVVALVPHGGIPLWTPAPTAETARLAAADRGDAILSLTVDDGLTSEESDLPDEYAAIASLFVD